MYDETAIILRLIVLLIWNNFGIPKEKVQSSKFKKGKSVVLTEITGKVHIKTCVQCELVCITVIETSVYLYYLRTRFVV
jgi:hypothetical protein